MLEHISVLQASGCSTLQVALNRLVEQFVTATEREGPKPAVYDMQVLSGWWSEKERGGPLVIVLEDFECFAPQVAQHLVETVSEYARNGMPLVFVFGIALSSDVIHRLVPRSTTRRLHIHGNTLHIPITSA